MSAAKKTRKAAKEAVEAVEEQRGSVEALQQAADDLEASIARLTEVVRSRRAGPVEVSQTHQAEKEAK